MTLDPRTPVVVGAATASPGPAADPADLVEPFELMVRAAEAAGADSDAPSLLAHADLVLVPRGSWTYGDPGRQVARALKNDRARTVLAELGILQTALLSRACAAIVRGEADVVLVCGGEARYRHREMERTGSATYTDDGGTPDETLRPAGRIISGPEVAAGLVSAASQYALIENARRAATGMTLPDHQRQIAELWAGFNRVARDNPEAWFRQAVSVDDLLGESGGNRPIAFPYRKWNVSQWNVDQAAALVVCSAEAARAHGLVEDGWVFPHAVAQSDHMTPVTERIAIERSPGFAASGAAALAAAGVGLDDLAAIDLYSCFPVAVFVQAAEMGIDLDRQLTLTGGMTWAGGPLNNYVLQAAVAMCRRLRGSDGAAGMVTAISGLVTKQGVAILGTSPPAAGCALVDVTPDVALQPTAPVSETDSGRGRVLTYTVNHETDPPRGVVVVELSRAGPARAVASTVDRDTVASMVADEWLGRSVSVDGSGGFVG